MNTYKALVRVPDGNSSIVVETAVQSTDINSACYLLNGLYGQDNVISLPQKIS